VVLSNLSVQELINIIKKLVNSDVKHIVDSRIKEFSSVGSANSLRWFEELAFCILAANFSARGAIKCIEKLKEENLILNGSTEDVSLSLLKCGHRFPYARAKYIVSGRKWAQKLKEKILSFNNVSSAREWLVKNFSGVGWKVASHFLRNVGFLNVAIIDRHILNIMHKYKLTNFTTPLNKRKYLHCEKILKNIANKIGISLGELDLYLWYLETGEILK